MSRAKLVDDSLRFAMNGDLSVDIAFSLISYLRKEFSWAPWRAALNKYYWFLYTFGGTSIQGLFEVINMLAPVNVN